MWSIKKLEIINIFLRLKTWILLGKKILKKALKVRAKQFYWMGFLPLFPGQK
jgi:glucose-6-phosphate-specific signal transduction histidine kinase